MSERTFTMDLPPLGAHSHVLLDGEDISDILIGVEVRSFTGEATEVRLYPSKGNQAQLVARLPESRVVIAAPTLRSESRAVVHPNETRAAFFERRLTELGMIEGGITDRVLNMSLVFGEFESTDETASLAMELFIKLHEEWIHAITKA